MGAAYSEDLRRCIIKASEQGYQSVRELAKRFEVGKTFVNNLLNRYKQTGNLRAIAVFILLRTGENYSECLL